MANEYELLLLIDIELDEDDRYAIVDRVRSLVEAHGEVTGEHDWGVRKLAYEIRHRPQAHYYLLQFDADAAAVRALPRELRIIEGLLRHRLVKLGKLPHEAPTPDRGEDTRDEQRRSGRRAGARSS